MMGNTTESGSFRIFSRVAKNEDKEQISDMTVTEQGIDQMGFVFGALEYLLFVSFILLVCVFESAFERFL